CDRWDQREYERQASAARHRLQCVTPSAYRRPVARIPSAEYLVLDIETIPDLERWKRPEVTQDTATPLPFPPTWAHRIIVIGCLWLDHDYRLKRLGVVGDPAGGEG